MDEDKRLCDLQYASLNYESLNFTHAEYLEALKMVDSPDNPNQLLMALIDVSSRCPSKGQQASVVEMNTGSVDPSASTTTSLARGSSASSSCYSSITSFHLSPDQSLESLQQPVGLRKIYIDGSNVARTHGKDVSFSWTGILLCVDWFCARQHQVKVFVPTDRCLQADESTLNYLYDRHALIETPTGCNDDLFIIEAARKNNGVIVSNDLFRDEKKFNTELQRFIHLNRLPYVFVDDLFIPANDPRGRSGPTLDEFLKEHSNDGAHSGSSNSSIHNSKLSRAKSYQRYQRSRLSAKRVGQHHHNNNTFHQSLQRTTGSLPLEQTRVTVTTNQDSNQPPGASVAQLYPNQNKGHKQVRNAISSANYSPSSTKESDTQPINWHRKSVACRTKSHNI